MSKTYSNWKIVTEADYVSMFIKTWFAYISTLRAMFPEAYSRRGDKKYLNAYKSFYKCEGCKNLVVDDTIMGHIKKLYCEGRKIIIEQYPEYYFWDFYRINDEFAYTFKDIPPDRSDCLVAALKLHKRRNSNNAFFISGFVRFWGTHYGSAYNEIIKFEINISEVISSSESYISEKPYISEQDFLSWLLESILSATEKKLHDSFLVLKASKEWNARLETKFESIMPRILTIYRSIFVLNGKDETYKNDDEMHLSRNTYEIIQQRPLNYFQYHMDVEWEPQDDMSHYAKEWFKTLSEDLKERSIIWFLDFVYRLRNSLFHEIIDPLDEKWQTVFKNSYLILKEIVDSNIDHLEKAEVISE